MMRANQQTTGRSHRALARGCSLVGAALLVAGCAVNQPARPVVRSDEKPFALPVVSRAGAPAGRPITFAFDPSPDASVVGYKLYFGATTNFDNVLDIGTNRTVTITNIVLPVHAAATAYNAAGIESVPSNQAGVLGKQVVVTGYDQRSDSPAGPFTDAGQVFTRTNPPTTFHRLRIESRNELVTYP